MTASFGATPLRTQALRTRSIAENVVLLTVLIEHEPLLDESRRCEFQALGHGFARAVIHFGYMENPDVPPVLQRTLATHLADFPVSDATFYVGRETFVAGKRGVMGPLAEALFAFLARNAKSATDHFGLPVERVIELGTRVDL